MYALIGTWEMCCDGLEEGRRLLANGACAGDAVETAIVAVEDEPSFSSVGYGGLPDREGKVRLDSAFMDGTLLRFGGIISAEGICNPIRAARLLCGRKTDCLLAGDGAAKFAVSHGLPMRNMLTDNARLRWQENLNEKKTQNSYRGHDTVCVLALDEHGHMAAGTSTSGLFMKQPGRVGDSPVIGSGFYCDDRYGAAAATGLGEEIMRGCLSYEIVRRMKGGLSPQQAAEEAVLELVDRKLQLGEDEGEISVIALNPSGEAGAATVLRSFPYAVGINGPVQLCAAYCCKKK